MRSDGRTAPPGERGRIPPLQVKTDMAMDDRTRKLSKQLRDRLLEVSDPEIAAIIRDAREEAIAEAKAIVKAAVVQACLGTCAGQVGRRNK